MHIVARVIEAPTGQGIAPHERMDIDDILAEIDGDALPQEVRDLHELTRAWVTERSAPEILPWPALLMERIMERIRQQVASHQLRTSDIAADLTIVASKIELVEEQTGNIDPKTNFRLIIIQTELERFKFLVRSFLRARIAKVVFPSSCALFSLTRYSLTLTLYTISTIPHKPPGFHLQRFNTQIPTSLYCQHTIDPHF